MLGALGLIKCWEERRRDEGQAKEDVRQRGEGRGDEYGEPGRVMRGSRRDAGERSSGVDERRRGGRGEDQEGAGEPRGRVYRPPGWFPAPIRSQLQSKLGLHPYERFQPESWCSYTAGCLYRNCADTAPSRTHLVKHLNDLLHLLRGHLAGDVPFHLSPKVLEVLGTRGGGRRDGLVREVRGGCGGHGGGE